MLQFADAVPRNHFLHLRQFLYFVDNNSDEDSDSKFFKIKPILEVVRNECIKNQKHFKSVCEQIISSKTKFIKIRQYNPKNLENGA